MLAAHSFSLEDWTQNQAFYPMSKGWLSEWIQTIYQVFTPFKKTQVLLYFTSKHYRIPLGLK